MEEETADVTARVTTEATCTAMGSTTYTAIFESEWAQSQTLIKQDIAVLPHTSGSDWQGFSARCARKAATMPAEQTFAGQAS